MPNLIDKLHVHSLIYSFLSFLYYFVYSTHHFIKFPLNSSLLRIFLYVYLWWWYFVD